MAGVIYSLIYVDLCARFYGAVICRNSAKETSSKYFRDNVNEREQARDRTTSTAGSDRLAIYGLAAPSTVTTARWAGKAGSVLKSTIGGDFAFTWVQAAS